MDLIDAALRCEKPSPRFAYVAPYYAQAKDVAWQYVKQYGGRIPGSATHESELRLDLPNGGRVRLYGAENYDRLRGLYFDGVVLDEAGDMDPRAWPEVIRPALSDRAGWATFIGTPKGRNSFFDTYEMSKREGDWFSLMLRASETGIVSASELEDAKRLLSPEVFEQEYECSFEAAVIGAYYGNLMRDAEKEGRICGVPVDPVVRVYTAWDLGIDDATAIWFFQLVGREIHVIDYLEQTGADLGYYVRELEQRGYLYGGHLLPHDAAARELGTGKTRVEMLESLGLKNVIVLPVQRVEDGINAVRSVLPRTWFDAKKAARGIDALRMYRTEWDDKLKTPRARPLHDWASHGADAFRQFAMGIDRIGSASTQFNKPLKYSSAGIY